MTGAKHSWLIWLAIVVSIAAFQYWNVFPKYEFMEIERKPYYIGIALFITLMSVFIYLNHSEKFASLILLGLAVNNLLDELFFNPTETGVNEVVLVIILSILWWSRRKIKEYEQYG